MTFLMMLSLILLSIWWCYSLVYVWSGIWFVATTRVSFWAWIWPTRDCRLGQDVAFWFQHWKSTARISLGRVTIGDNILSLFFSLCLSYRSANSSCRVASLRRNSNCVSHWYLQLFLVSGDSGSIDEKKDWSVHLLLEKNHLLRCGDSLSLLSWIGALTLLSIAKTASKVIIALIRSIKFLSPKVTLYFYKPTIRLCLHGIPL